MTLYYKTLDHIANFLTLFISLLGVFGGLKPNADGLVYKVDYDYYLKLDYGPFGVGGRSVVIHLPDVNKTRLDCADILPLTSHKRRRKMFV